MPVNPYSKVTVEDYNWFKRFFQTLVVFFLAVFVYSKYRLTIEGKENIPKGSGYIVAANHMSNLDPPLVSVAMRWTNIAYMAKSELYETPFSAWFFHHVGTFAVNRQKMEISTIKSAKEVLKSSWPLGMFPEGTRNKDATGIKELKKGVAFISKAANVPVLPVGLSHAPDDHRKVTVRFGKLIEPKATVEEMSAALQQALLELTGKPLIKDEEEGKKALADNVIPMPVSKETPAED